MSAAVDIWRLPGPAAYVGEIARRVEGGQHVAAVLPQYLADDPDRSDALAVAVLDAIQQRVHRARRVQPWSADGPLVAALGQQVCDYDAPVTVPDLIAHPDVQGETLVCLLDDLDPTHQAELPEFLRRLEIESRSVSVEARCCIVVVLGRSRLPQFPGNERSEVTLVTCWYWNRVSRFDVAAHLAAGSGASGQTGVLREVRTETIIELARWNFDLATRLDACWSGEREDLAALCAGPEAPEHTIPPGGREELSPPDSAIDAWDVGDVDCWHERTMLAPSRRLAETSELNRHLWTGQARVLLPWIEITRDRLERRVRDMLGSERFDSALRAFAPEEFDPVADVAEIGLLQAVVNARLGRSDPKMREAARTLRKARNELAHLRPLEPARMEELVRVCAFLRG